ncbi:glycosyltransferase family 1 protein [Patescibacteria group bacterium]|nr:MAG: glycosyltransferase family 1 protein [Patescibacteria group bacterium]
MPACASRRVPCSMKLLFFNYEYPPLGGGAANANAYIFREYARFPDLEIDFITSSIDAEYHLETVGERVRIHRLPIGKSGKNLHYQSQKELLVYAWKAYRFASQLARKNKYDLSHSFFTVPCGVVSWIMKVKYKIPYIVSLRGSDVPGYSERFTLIYKILTPIITFVWRKSAAVISNSQGLKELALKSAPKQNIGIIYNGIDMSEFAFAERPVTSDKFTVLCVSRITPRKGIRYLIEAVAQVANKYPFVKLQLIGEGDEKEELERMTNDKLKISNVEFLGRIEHNKLPTYYQNADVFVLPSLNEGMSNTMLEALASGLPLVSTNTGGAEELVAEGKNGFLVKMKDADDIATKLETLIQNSELKQSMAKESRAKAESLSWEKIAKQYFAQYQDVLKKKA